MPQDNYVERIEVVEESSIIEYSTLVPNIIFEKWMNEINHASFMVLMYFFRHKVPLNISSLVSACNISKPCISNALKELLKHKLIKQWVFLEEDVVSSLKSRKELRPYNSLSIKKNCEWCECETVILHKHHYPISRKNRGNDVVNICANCHSEFHFFMDSKFYVLGEI